MQQQHINAAGDVFKINEEVVATMAGTSMKLQGAMVSFREIRGNLRAVVKSGMAEYIVDLSSLEKKPE